MSLPDQRLNHVLATFSERIKTRQTLVMRKLATFRN